MQCSLDLLAVNFIDTSPIELLPLCIRSIALAHLSKRLGIFVYIVVEVIEFPRQGLVMIASCGYIFQSAPN